MFKYLHTAQPHKNNNMGRYKSGKVVSSAPFRSRKLRLIHLFKLQNVTPRPLAEIMVPL